VPLAGAGINGQGFVHPVGCGLKSPGGRLGDGETQHPRYPRTQLRQRVFRPAALGQGPSAEEEPGHQRRRKPDARGAMSQEQQAELAKKPGRLGPGCETILVRRDVVLKRAHRGIAVRRVAAHGLPHHRGEGWRHAVCRKRVKPAFGDPSKNHM
jgi:hypothetical protein